MHCNLRIISPGERENALPFTQSNNIIEKARERESEEEGDGHNALASAYGQSLIYFNVFNTDDVQMAASLRGFSVVPFFLWLFISKNCLQMQVQCVCVVCVCACVSHVCSNY